MHKLKLGDRVKINFTKTKGEVEGPRNAETGELLPWKFSGEMMWVVVTGPKNKETDSYTGRLINKPMAVDYKYNDKVKFFDHEVIERRPPSFKAKIIYNIIDWFNPHWSR
jgi:hypothetical protein